MLRPYQKEDITAIQLLFRETLTRSNYRDYSPVQLAAWMKGIASENLWHEKLASGTTVLAVDKNGDPQGFGMLTKDGVIDFLFVHPDWQRKGIGLLILNELECHAKMLGLSFLESDVSITARDFFENNGYEVIVKQELYRNGAILENFKMKKTLFVK